MKTSTRRVVNHSDSRTAYWEYGNPAGFPLIMVHGFRGDHHGLELLAQHFTEHRVIVPDLPGFGESGRLTQPHTLPAFGAWLRSFQHEVAPGKFSVLGHSFGSLVVSQAISEGLNPHTLTLINPISAPALEGPRAILSKLAIGYYAAGAKLPEQLADPLMKHPAIVRLMSETMAKTRNSELRAWIHDQHDRYFSTYTDREALLEAFTASVSHTVTEFHEAFTMPTHIVAGAQDDITPLEQQLRLARTIPGHATISVMKHSGHLVHYEAHESSARSVKAFLLRWEPAV